MKQLLVILVFYFSLFGIENVLLQSTVKKLMPAKSYLTHKKLINIIFHNEEGFFDQNGEIKIMNVIKTLKENGLLKIFYKTPQKMKITFITNTISSIFLLKTISDSLNKLGYQYTFTDELKKEQSKTTWKITYLSEHVIDPVTLYEEISRYGIEINDVLVNNTSWTYYIKASHLKLPNAKEIDSTTKEQVYLNIKGKFWFYLKDNNTTFAFISSIYPDFWYPYVVCYDNNLTIKKIYKRNKPTRDLKLFIPKNSKYIKISDMAAPQNLKHGIRIKVE